jgi:hypothetical protein
MDQKLFIFILFAPLWTACRSTVPSLMSAHLRTGSLLWAGEIAGSNWGLQVNSLVLLPMSHLYSLKRAIATPYTERHSVLMSHPYSLRFTDGSSNDRTSNDPAVYNRITNSPSLNDWTSKDSTSKRTQLRHKTWEPTSSTSTTNERTSKITQLRIRLNFQSELCVVQRRRSYT